MQSITSEQLNKSIASDGIGLAPHTVPSELIDKIIASLLAAQDSE